MPSIIIFPGQGSQFVGMGKRLLYLPKVERMFQLANETFKCDLLSMCLNGPKSELDKTLNCQAAVFVTSLAAVEHLKETEPHIINQCYATAGFSVGEYASLVLAGVISYEDGLKLLKVRSDAMQKASEQISSGLMTVFVKRNSNLNLAMRAARQWCTKKLNIPEENVECQIANYLFSQCKVIGGNTEALEFIETNYKEFNITKIKRLPVSGAFHTRLMKSAEKPLYNALKDINFQKPFIKFYSNFESELCLSPNKIRRNLVKQVSSPVKWEQIINTLYYDPNLPIDSAQSNAVIDKEDEGEKIETGSKKNVSPPQSKDRIYPDIYECGPASQTGPLLNVINRKAFQFYKHIPV